MENMSIDTDFSNDPVAALANLFFYGIMTAENEHKERKNYVSDL